MLVRPSRFSSRMKCRVEFNWCSGGSFGPLAKRCVKDGRVGTRNEQAGRIALAVALDFTAGRIGRVLCIATRAKRRFVQQRAAIQDAK